MNRNEKPLSPIERAKQLGMSLDEFTAQAKKQVDEYFLKEGFLDPETYEAEHDGGTDEQSKEEVGNGETDDSDSVARLIFNAKTPEDLEWALHELRVDDDFAKDGFERMYSKSGFERYRLALQQVMVNMRRANPKLPAVPTSNNDLDYVNWCFDAKSQDDDKQPQGKENEQPGADEVTKTNPPHRPPVYDPVKDAKMVEKWEASKSTVNKPTMAEFEKLHNLKPGELTKIKDRHRGRQRPERQNVPE